MNRTDAFDPNDPEIVELMADRARAWEVEKRARGHRIPNTNRAEMRRITAAADPTADVDPDRRYYTVDFPLDANFVEGLRKMAAEWNRIAAEALKVIGGIGNRLDGLKARVDNLAGDKADLIIFDETTRDAMGLAPPTSKRLQLNAQPGSLMADLASKGLDMSRFDAATVLKDHIHDTVLSRAAKFTDVTDS